RRAEGQVRVGDEAAPRRITSRCDVTRTVTAEATNVNVLNMGRRSIPFSSPGNSPSEEEHVSAQLGDGGCNFAEGVGVIDTVARDQPDARAVLVGEHAPPIDLFRIDPAVAMEGRASERRRHGNQRERTTTTGTSIALSSIRPAAPFAISQFR